MRRMVLTFFAAAALLAPLGLALSTASPAPAVLKAPARAAAPLTGVADFPNCPAPAVNGINIRAASTQGVPALTIFVVVQNVGHRAFFAASGAARLEITQGGQSLGAFPLERLAAGEVKFFAVAGSLAPRDVAGDVVAAIDFAPSALTGRVADTLDCQTSDNRSVRKGPSIRASLQRAEG